MEHRFDLAVQRLLSGPPDSYGVTSSQKPRKPRFADSRVDGKVAQAVFARPYVRRAPPLEALETARRPCGRDARALVAAGAFRSVGVCWRRSLVSTAPRVSHLQQRLIQGGGPAFSVGPWNQNRVNRRFDLPVGFGSNPAPCAASSAAAFGVES